jgi:hypothetical protein
MKEHRPFAVPITAVIVLLVVGYVGTYLANVTPGDFVTISNYRFGEGWSERFYWPAEHIDRRLRPRAWGRQPWRDIWDLPTAPKDAHG